MAPSTFVRAPRDRPTQRWSSVYGTLTGTHEWPVERHGSGRAGCLGPRAQRDVASAAHGLADCATHPPEAPPGLSSLGRLLGRLNRYRIRIAWPRGGERLDARQRVQERRRECHAGLCTQKTRVDEIADRAIHRQPRHELRARESPPPPPPCHAHSPPPPLWLPQQR